MPRWWLLKLLVSILSRLADCLPISIISNIVLRSDRCRLRYHSSSGLLSTLTTWYPRHCLLTRCCISFIILLIWTWCATTSVAITLMPCCISLSRVYRPPASNLVRSSISALDRMILLAAYWSIIMLDHLRWIAWSSSLIIPSIRSIDGLLARLEFVAACQLLYAEVVLRCIDCSRDVLNLSPTWSSLLVS